MQCDISNEDTWKNGLNLRIIYETVLKRVYHRCWGIPNPVHNLFHNYIHLASALIRVNFGNNTSTSIVFTTWSNIIEAFDNSLLQRVSRDSLRLQRLYTIRAIIILLKNLSKLSFLYFYVTMEPDEISTDLSRPLIPIFQTSFEIFFPLPN